MRVRLIRRLLHIPLSGIIPSYLYFIEFLLKSSGVQFDYRLLHYSRPNSAKQELGPKYKLWSLFVSCMKDQETEL